MVLRICILRYVLVSNDQPSVPQSYSCLREPVLIYPDLTWLLASMSATAVIHVLFCQTLAPYYQVLDGALDDYLLEWALSRCFCGSWNATLFMGCSGCYKQHRPKCKRLNLICSSEWRTYYNIYGATRPPKHQEKVGFSTVFFYRRQTVEKPIITHQVGK